MTLNLISTKHTQAEDNKSMSRNIHSPQFGDSCPKFTLPTNKRINSLVDNKLPMIERQNSEDNNTPQLMQMMPALPRMERFSSSRSESKPSPS